MTVMILFITISLDRSADSLATIVTSNAGASVLTECNKELHDSFGVLAFKNDTSRLSNLAHYYISESIDGINRFIHLKLEAVLVETGDSSDLYYLEFKDQLAALGKKSIVKKYNQKEGLSYFSGTYLPSQIAYSSSSLNPSLVLSRLDSSYTPGSGLFATQYVMSNLTINEIEYVVFGGVTASQNESSCWNTIFAIRCLINCVEEIEDPILWLEAIMRAMEETDQIMNDELQLRNYLSAMLFVMSSSKTMYLRVMDVMQLTIGNGFYFKDYAYSFDITARYKRGEKNGLYTQHHSWT